MSRHRCEQRGQRRRKHSACCWNPRLIRSLIVGINGSYVMLTLPRPAANINKFRSPIISPIKASNYTSNWLLNTTRLSFLTCPHECRIGPLENQDPCEKIGKVTGRPVIDKTGLGGIVLTYSSRLAH